MLHIILIILKIIGIILLCILGVLILAICCALFVPVRYQIRLSREEGEDNPPFMAYVKITWMLHLANILIRYPADVILRARIAVFTLFTLPEKKKTKRTKEKVRAVQEREVQGKEEPLREEQGKKDKQGEIEEKPEEAGLSLDAESADGGYKSDKSTCMANGQEICERDISRQAFLEQEAEKSRTEEKISLTAKIRRIVDKIKQFIEKIKALFENIQYTIRKICDKIKSTLDNIQYYKEVLESETFQQSFQLCKGEVGTILKAIKPDKFEADLTVGTDDPATTGEILAVYGMLYPFVGEHIRVLGDFERAHIEGQLYIRGKIRAFTFLRAAIRIYFNKDIKSLIKLLKKEAT